MFQNVNNMFRMSFESNNTIRIKLDEWMGNET